MELNTNSNTSPKDNDINNNNNDDSDKNNEQSEGLIHAVAFPSDFELDIALLSSNNELTTIFKSNDQSFLSGQTNIIEHLITKYSGVPSEKLDSVDNITLKLPKNFGLLSDFGFHLNNLKHLTLTGSYIPSLNELGTSFKQLQSLNVSHCELEDLSGVICFEQLAELDASFNKIKDLIDIEMCATIEKLVLNDNDIEDEDNIYFIMSLPKLQKLNIKNNPFTMKLKDFKFDENIQIVI